jgi:membrane protein implicated in regulation of membrane protease activity
MSEQRPTARAAGAGMYLLAALIVCAALGLGAGWLAGNALAGAAVGFAIGVPLSFYLVYRQYRDI